MKKILSIVLLVALMCTLTACGGKKEAAKSANLGEVMAKFNLNGENMMTMEAADIEAFYGIPAADMKQYAAAVSTTGINCDEIVLIEATDADAAKRVKTALDNRYQAKLNETDGYLPEENAIIKTCSVTIDGNYVAMIVGPNAADMVKIYNESFK